MAGSARSCSLDVLKTRAQQSMRDASSSHAGKTSPTLRDLCRMLWREGQAAAASRDPLYAQRSSLARATRSSRGFLRGLKLGTATSALQSAIIITVFEVGVAWLGH